MTHMSTNRTPFMRWWLDGTRLAFLEFFQLIYLWGLLAVYYAAHVVVTNSASNQTLNNY